MYFLLRKSGAALVVLCICVAGCADVNQPLNPANRQLEHRTHNHTFATLAAEPLPLTADWFKRIGQPEILPNPPHNHNSPPEATPHRDVRADGYFVGLAISGGGSRSANFGAACMFQLQRIGLLEHVDYISSVSGGSLTAAYYCLSEDAQWNPGTVQEKLTSSFASDVIARTLLPWNLPALLLTRFDRSDLLARSFTTHLFSRDGRPLTFADLRPDRPRLLINATDLQSGRKFVFTNEAFDQLNSDLGTYPVSYAVAASSAVPVLLHHVTLRDYSTIFKQYRHLIDGGVVDNLGVQSLVETYAAHIEGAQRDGRPDPYPRGAVLFVLDARTEFDARLSDKADTGLIETLVTGAGLTSTALVNRVSSAILAEIIVEYAADDITAKELRQSIRDLTTTGDLTIQDRNGKPVRVVHLALSHVKNLGNLPYSSFTESVNSIQTYFNIEPTEAFNLYQAADLLVHERFERQLMEIKAKLESPAAVPDAAPTGQ